MCGGVEYLGRTVYFPKPGAELPVVMRGERIGYLPWGRRKWEKGKLPATGWARLESIREGWWDRWQPHPIKIKVDRFMEKDAGGEPHWYDLKAQPQEYIQGLLATYHQERRVYVVTITPATPEQRAVHGRWPRIVA